MNAWTILVIAGVLEVGWAIGLKYSEGFKRPLPSVLTILSMIVSMYLLGKAAETLPIGTAYAVWVGIGAAGAGLLGMILLNEPVSIPRIFFMILLVFSIIGLKLTSAQ